MDLYRFCGYIQGDKVAGIVRASSIKEAKRFLKNTYYDYNLWQDKTLEKVIFNEDNVCEIYYGC